MLYLLNKSFYTCLHSLQTKDSSNFQKSLKVIQSTTTNDQKEILIETVNVYMCLLSNFIIFYGRINCFN